MLTGERDLGHPWPQAETLLCTVLECHIYLVSILFYLCFELLKRKPVLRCHAGVLLAVLGVGGDAGMLSPASMSVSQKSGSIQTSLVQQYPLVLIGIQKKYSCGVTLYNRVSLSPSVGK